MSRLILALMAVLLAAPALAAEPKLISTNKKWKAYEYSDNGGKVCYMASEPSSTQPAGLRRDPAFAMITHRPAEKSLSVVSIVAGYTYKSGSEVTATIGNQRFSLFTDGDTAWARDDATDKALAEAIKNGEKMVVVGTSSRGTQTTDTFVLSGTTAAYKDISKRCGVQ